MLQAVQRCSSRCPRPAVWAGAARALSASRHTRSAADDDVLLRGARESMAYDVVIVGAGPAGLGASIRMKQLAKAAGKELSVCVVEKGAEVGAHILSGNVFEPRALNELIPDWWQRGAPIDTPVTEDSFLLLSQTGSVKLPNVLLPSYLHNNGNYVISLGKLVRWLGTQAEELGVDIFPGFSASEVLYDDKKAVRGIATRDMGINKNGTPKPTFARGMELRARQTIFAEGCRGSCSEAVMKTFDLRAKCQPQTYGIGLKEVWEVPAAQARPGFVQHTLGWPLQSSLMDKTFGGSFLYHMRPNLVLLGLVVGLDYENPYLSPYEEFQRWKHHPEVARHIQGGTPLSYGARCLIEGGLHSIPKLSFPGGVLVGDSAGFLNSVKIKGSHTALKSGMVAAEQIFDALSGSASVAETGEISATDAVLEVASYQKALEASWVYEELKVVRNCHASFHFGFLPGLVHSGFSTFVSKGKEPWTVGNHATDSEKTKKAAECTPIAYPKPDGKLSFDLLSNLSRSGTNHTDQPSHLRIKPALAFIPEKVSLQEYAGPEQRFCPAKVYEYNEKQQLVINAQNCLHCKACSIKMPGEYIDWTVPEGGGGPAYEAM